MMPLSAEAPLIAAWWNANRLRNHQRTAAHLWRAFRCRHQREVALKHGRSRRLRLQESRRFIRLRHSLAACVGHS